MSTSAYYSFIPTPTGKGATSRQVGATSRNHPLAIAHLSATTTIASPNSARQSAISPSSFATSSSTSSSSLNQYSSLTPISVASSSASYSAASSASSTSSTSSSSSSSSCSSSASPLSIRSTAIVRGGNCEVVSSNCSSANSNHHDELGPVHFQHDHHHQDVHEDHHHQQSGRQRRSSVTPVQTNHQRQIHQLIHSYTLHSLEPKPLKPFKSSSDYLEAMKEDLSEWLNRLYPDLDLSTENFFNQLETGSIICRHANNVTHMGRNFMVEQQQRDNSNDSNHETNNNNNLTLSPSSNSSSSVSGSNGSGNQDSSINSLYSDKSQPSSVSSNQLNSSMMNVSANLTRLDSRGNINWFRVKTIPFKLDARPGTFFARDNICQFILWCRSLNILECLLFETDDLVARKNEKSFILCLLEVARIGFKVGMPTPLIIQLEQEIDREIENEAKLQKQLEQEREKRNRSAAIAATVDSYSEDCDVNGVGLNKTNGLVDKLQDEEARQNELKNDQADEEEEEDFGPKPQVITNDLLSLHEKVVQLLCQCTCPTQFPMVRVGDNGKYKVGDKLIIFVRILRRHIMVRVGGGWQELSEFLRVKDPCRSKLYQPNNHHNHLHHQQLNHQVKLASHSTISKSRLVESSHHLNKALGHHNYRNGQRMISSSASMSWLSHNS